MRLLTLYQNLLNTNNKAQFESNLEQDLELEPNTKLALVNANMVFNLNIVEITRLNNTIKFFTSLADRQANIFNSVELDLGTFTSSSLLDNLQYSINSSLPYLGDLKITAGLSSQCTVDDNNNLNIQLKQATSQVFDPVLNPNDLLEIDNTTGTPTMVRSATASLTFGGYALMDKIPMNNGPALANFKLDGFEPGIQDFAVGLVNEVVDYNVITALQPSDYLVCLTTQDTGEGVNYAVAGSIIGIGAVIVTNVPVVENDVIFMRISDGGVQFVINAEAFLDPVPFKQQLGKSDNYVYMTLVGSGTRMEYGSYHFDPFFVVPSGDTGKVDIDLTGIFTLDFNNSGDLPLILGFSNDLVDGRLVIQGGVTTFNASDPLALELAEDSGFNISIDNLPLKSFNFTEGVNKSQPILHTVPQGIRDSNGVVSYVPPYRVEINLNNAFPLNLRNLRFSVRNVKDNSLVPLKEITFSIAIL
jgi:hypothetical protein